MFVDLKVTKPDAPWMIDEPEDFEDLRESNL